MPTNDEEEEEMIPKSRFDEVNRKFRDYQTKNADLLLENATLKGTAATAEEYKTKAEGLQVSLTKANGFAAAGIQDADVGDIVYDRWKSADVETPFSDWVKTTKDPIVGKLLSSPAAPLASSTEEAGGDLKAPKTPLPNTTGKQVTKSGQPPSLSKVVADLDTAISEGDTKAIREGFVKLYDKQGAA